MTNVYSVLYLAIHYYWHCTFYNFTAEKWFLNYKKFSIYREKSFEIEQRMCCGCLRKPYHKLEQFLTDDNIIYTYQTKRKGAFTVYKTTAYVYNNLYLLYL